MIPTPGTIDGYVNVAERVIFSNLIGFLLLLALVVGQGVLLWFVFRHFMFQLAQCREDHARCERRNMVISRAVVSLADGKRHDAKAAAQAILDMDGAD